MPIVNGYELCSQIRRVSSLKDLPIVMLTSQDGIVDRVRAKVVKASAFLPKPIEPTKLLQTVAQFAPIQHGKDVC
jgi:chemotaxis family two-component system response regulator PixG